LWRRQRANIFHGAQVTPSSIRAHFYNFFCHGARARTRGRPGNVAGAAVVQRQRTKRRMFTERPHVLTTQERRDTLHKLCVPGRVRVATERYLQITPGSAGDAGARNVAGGARVSQDGEVL
jgi:hypothetical protein